MEPIEREPDVELTMPAMKFSEVTGTLSFVQDICPEGKVVRSKTDVVEGQEHAKYVQKVWFVDRMRDK